MASPSTLKVTGGHGGWVTLWVIGSVFCELLVDLEFDFFTGVTGMS